MKTIYCRMGALGILVAASPVFAQSAFTPAQQAEIARLLAEQRVEVRAEVLEELHQRDARSPENTQADHADTSQRSPIEKSSLALLDEQTGATAAQGRFLADVGVAAPVGGNIDTSKSHVDVTTSTANSQASLKLNFPSDAIPNPDRSVTWHTSSIAFSAPISKGDTETRLATLDGLANAFTMSFAFDRFYVSEVRDPAASGNLSRRFIELCQMAGIDAPNAQCDTDLVKTGLARSGLSPERQKTAYQEFLTLGTAPATRFAYGVKGTIGQESYDFFNNTTLKKNSSERQPWALSGYVGLIPPNSSWYLGGGFEYQHAYKAGKTGTFCPAASDGNPVECTTGSFGQPTDDAARLVYLEARRRFPGVAKAMSIRLTHDFADGATGVDMPIYFVGDGDGALNGGLRLGWTNTDHFTCGIFIGSSFELYPFHIGD